MLLRPLCCIVVLSVAAPFAASGLEVTIDASAPPPPPAPLAFAVGGRSPSGHVLGANSRYLTLDGKPFFPVMGEFHYTRYPAAEWETELLKMKAGGITVVSTYVFWIHHEEREGRFDWTGRRDLRRFVELCGNVGLYAWVRIGPWDHGEVRNGGFPDWLLKETARPRSNDPAYLAQVRRFYGEIGRQLQGLFWKDGGPIAGVQIENEYHPGPGGIEHMQTLLGLAHEAGIDAPFYTATGWDNAAVPPTGFLPVFGGYTEQFWSASRTELPPNQNFFFTPIRAEDNVMGDLSPKNAGYNAKYEKFPFLTAEMGGGMAIAYHRRPVMHAADSTAAALVKVGAGIAGLGYYMYHGGTNPDGLTSLQETMSAWNGYNDLEAKSYDFQAPLGEFGQVNETYRTLRALDLFLADFGSPLAAMPAAFPAQAPASRDDTDTPRVSARSDGRSGFIFINNYQRLHPLGPKRDFQVALKLPAGTLEVPRRPTTIPAGVYTHWPVNLDLGGVTLRYATAELLCRLDDPDLVVFSAWPGLDAEFAFATGDVGAVAAPGARVSRENGVTYVTGLHPGTAAAIDVARPGGGHTRVVLLARAQALQLARARLGGRDRLVLSPGDVYFAGDVIHVVSRDPANLRVEVCPALARPDAPFRAAGTDGLFQVYADAAPPPDRLPAIEVTAGRAAAPSLPVTINPNPRRAVAREPADADFARAAVWRIRVPGGIDPSMRVFLRISYVGDVARLYAGERFADDNFYKGAPWEIGLWRFTPEELSHGLELRILPLRADAPIYLPAGARPEFSGGADVLRLEFVDAVPEFHAVLDAGR